MLRRLGALLSWGILMPNGDPSLAAAVSQSAWAKCLSEIGITILPDGAGTRSGGRILAGGLLEVAAGVTVEQGNGIKQGTLDRATEPSVLLRWNAPSETPEAERQAAWHLLWQSANLLLPLSRCWAGTDDTPELAPFLASPLVRGDRPAGSMEAGWIEVSELACVEIQAWVPELVRLGIEPPVVGFELLDEKGRVVAEAELAWLERKLAVVLEPGTHESHFEQRGWRCFTATDGLLDPAWLAALRGGEDSL